MIVSTFRRRWCLSACQKNLEILHFNKTFQFYWLTAFWPIIGDTQFCQIWGCCWNINKNISFHFRLRPRKINNKIFQKRQKTHFEAMWPEWAHPFMTMPIPIFFDQLLISMNLYQHAKNQAFSWFRSRNIIYLKILQSDWPKTFWHISQEPSTAININFHYRPN